MTLDTSAILAVLLDEPDRAALVGRIEQADRRLVSTMTVLEAAMVLEGRKGDDAGHDLDQFLARGDIGLVLPGEPRRARSMVDAEWAIIAARGGDDERGGAVCGGRA